MHELKRGDDSRSTGWIIKSTTLAFFILTMLAGGTSFAEHTVSAQLKKRIMRIGDTTTLEIIVDGSSETDISVSPLEISGLRISGPHSSRSQQTTIINGRMESSVKTTVSYQITGLKEGTYPIPSMTVSIAGTDHTVGPFSLKVEKTPESSEILLRSTISKTNPFIEEPVQYTVSWFVANQVEDYSLVVPAMETRDDIRVEVIQPPAASRTVELVIGRARLPATAREKTIDGITYTEITLRFTVYPLVTGRLSLGIPFVRASIRDGWTVERDFFGFSQRVPKTKTISAAATEHVLVVSEIPAEGRPRGFSGAIGRYSLTANAEPREVRVGDPIRIELTVQGTGLLDRIPRIDLSDYHAVLKDFTVVESLEPGEIRGDRVIFEQIVRAKSDSVMQFPEVSLIYFDTDRKRYDRARSQPIDLTVNPAPSVGPLESFGMNAEFDRPPSETIEGLRALYRGKELNETRKNPWRSLILLIIAPCSYALLECAIRMRRSMKTDRTGWRRRRMALTTGRAFKRIRGLVDEGGDVFFSELADTCAELISLRLKIGKGEITVHDIPRLIETGKIGKHSAVELEQFLSEIDALRFGPHSADSAARDDLLEKARRVISEMKR